MTEESLLTTCTTTAGGKCNFHSDLQDSIAYRDSYDPKNIANNDGGMIGFTHAQTMCCCASTWNSIWKNFEPYRDTFGDVTFVILV